MEISYSEIVLFIWGIVMTVLWQRALHESGEFKKFTVFKLKEVARGEAKIVDDGESIQIIRVKG